LTGYFISIYIILFSHIVSHLTFFLNMSI